MGTKHDIKVRGVRRDTIDITKLVSALLLMVEDLQGQPDGEAGTADSRQQATNEGEVR